MKDLRTGQTLPDTTERVTSLAWAADNKTLFLVTEDAVTKRSDKLWRHVLGTTKFEEIYNEKDELFDIEIGKTRDMKYLFLQSEAKDTSEARYLRADRPADAFAVFLPREKGHRYYLDHREGLFYIRTNKSGRNFAVMTAPVNSIRAQELEGLHRAPRQRAHPGHRRVQGLRRRRWRKARRWTTCASTISKPARGRRSRFRSRSIRSSPAERPITNPTLTATTTRAS